MNVDLRTRLNYQNRITDEELRAALALAEAATEIPGWPGYKIDMSGRVFSCLSNWRGYGTRIMSQPLNQDGYPVVRLTDGSRRRRIPVHILVLRTFIGRKPSRKYQARHLDGNRKNNHLQNLAWGTAQENANDRGLHGNHVIGERNANYKTHCKRGHDLSVFGTMRKTGGRSCKICHRLHVKEFACRKKKSKN